MFGPAPGGDQQLVDDDRLVADPQRDRVPGRGADRVEPGVQPHVHALAPQRRGHLLRRERAPADASSRGPRTSSTTSEPSRRHACASSQPTTPPPSTPRRRGTACAEVASRLVQVRTESRPGIGGRTGTAAGGDDDGVPGAHASRRRPGPAARRRAGPGRARTVIPAPSAQSTWLVVVPVVGDRVAPLQHAPRRRTPRRHRAAGGRRRPRRPVRSSALLGMHAQYEHSPPTSSDSTRAVDSPARCA